MNVSVFSRYICVCVSLQLVQGDDSYSGKLKYLFTNISLQHLYICLYALLYVVKLAMSLAVRKPAFCICENKDADQLRGDREADQRDCFRYTESTIPLLHKSEISSL